MMPLMITNATYRALDNEYSNTYMELQNIYYTEVLPFGRADDQKEYERLQARLGEISRTMDQWREISSKAEELLKH